MRSALISAAVLLTLGASHAQAAVKQFDVKYRQAIQVDDRRLHEARSLPHGFRMEIVSDPEGVKQETYKNGRPYVVAQKGERYSLRLYNPLPVAVAVNLTVDGLNSISGKPCGIAEGQKWIIDPHGTVTIPGWQVSGGETRRFFFTDKPKSYAKWRGDETGMDLAANCGVIGAAFFWSQKDLDRYYDDHPLYRFSHRPTAFSGSRNKASGQMMAASACAEMVADQATMKEEEKAGTGMGERESHPTVQVDFDYDRGMYTLAQALVIYYDFEKHIEPNPFPALGYAPEMP